MRVSACVIVKNEAHNLPRWLRCMQALAEEIVVVDTGSTDETVAIAEAAGVRVAHFAWRNDFAAAKNYAIDQTTGDWVLLLDADEFFPEAQWPAVRAAIARYDAQYEVIGLICDWLNFDEDNHNARLSAGYQIRIFRRLPDLRYERAIHEALCYRGHEHRIFKYVPGIAIHHTGYSTRQGQGKGRRNLEILLARIAAGEGTMDDEYYLVDSYAGLEEWDKVIYYAQRVTQSQDVSNGGHNNTYMLWLQALLKLERPAAEVQAVLDEARQKFPQMAGFFIMQGELDWREKDYQRALADYQKALQVYAAFTAAHDQQAQAAVAQVGQPASGQDTEQQQLVAAQAQLLLDDTPTMLPYVYARLAQLLRWRGRTEAALDYVARGLEANPREPLLCVELLRLLADVDDADCIAALNRIYDKTQDAAFLLEMLPHLGCGGRPRVQLYYQRQLTGNAVSGQELLPVSRTEQYLWGGKLSEAARALRTDVQARLALGNLARQHGAEAGALAVLRPQANYG